MSQAVNGVQVIYNYESASAHGALYKVISETQINGVPVPGKSTREIRFVSASGNTMRAEKYALVGENWIQTDFENFEYDSRNQWTKRTRGNARETTREMMCCGTLWQIDEDGVRTDFTYNSARQLSETMRSSTATMPEKITVFELDALGKITREIVKLDGPTFSEKSSSYDILGRTISETDELGRTTNFSYSADGLTETITLPNGATKITEKHADGNVVRVAGTAQREILTVF